MSDVLTTLLVLAVLLSAGYGLAVGEAALRGAGPAAVWLPLARAWSLLRQEDLVPRGADFRLFRSAPLLALVAVALGALVIPLGPGWIGFDPPIGVFYFIVVLGPFAVGMMNAGWSQNSKVGLFGTFRAAAHLISYEVPLGFAIIGPVMAAGSLSTTHIVAAQAGLWYAVWQPLGLAIYLPAALMVSFHHPFDIPQSGAELAGGVFSEYSGARLLLWRVALDAMFVLLMAMGVVLFFGGGQGPLLPAPLWFLLKTAGLSAAVLIATRYCPRLRQDQMLTLAWKVLLPASLLNVALVGILTLILIGGSP